MRTLLASALLLALAPLAAAQPTFGIRAGLNVASVTDIDAGGGLDPRPRLGFVGGAFAEVPLTPAFAVRPEVLYSQKGESTDEGVLTLVQDYVEVPVLGRLAVYPSPTLEVGLLAGPYVGLKLTESVRLESGSQDTDRVENVDYGLAVGGEVGSGPFFVDLRYTLGLADVFENAGERSPRNSVFTVGGTFKFGR